MEAVIRKWGNSYGILLKKEEITKRSLHEGDVIELELKEKKNIDLTPLFGLCSFKKSVDQIKKEIKEQYYED